MLALDFSWHMEEIFNFELFSLGEQAFTFGQALITVISLFLIIYAYRIVLKFFFPRLESTSYIDNKSFLKFKRIIRWLLILSLIIALVIFLKLDMTFQFTSQYALSVLLILKALFFLQIARLLDWLINNLVINNYYRFHKSSEDKKGPGPKEIQSARKTVQYIFYTLISIYVLRNFGLDFSFHSTSINGQLIEFKFSQIFIAILVILIAQLVIWGLTQIILYNLYQNKSIEVGSQYAINQLIKYVIYIFAIVFALDTLGINMRLLLGGAAALLVGVGLGLQQTFNDFISGIVLLFERTVSVGDVLEFQNTVGTVKKIGLRSSIVETRSNVSIVVPNHLLVNDSVINWTHFNDKVRFTIDVGVAYGSDTSLVKKLLVNSVENNPYILKYPSPFIRFESFGESSLDFKLYFFSRNYMVIEDIKSDIRLEIDKLFRENNISVPFPQRDLHIKRD